MSSRALRRLQKQQEEQKAQQLAEASDSDHDDVPANSNKSAFALLHDADENDHDDDRVSEAEEVITATSAPSRKSAQNESPQPKSSGKKKKNKKKKPKATKVTTANDSTEEDDIDAVLASIVQQDHNKTGAPDGGTTSSQNDYEHLLAVDSQNLHAINEMRRLFGRDVIGDQPRQQQPVARRGRGQRIQRETGFPAVTLKRNLFVQGKEEWPRATTGGLGMEVVHKDPNTGVTEYRFVHSMAYQETQRQYEIAVASMDPQRLVVLLEHNPYHIATLLQVSEIMKHDRMHTEAGDMLERALFAFGRTVHSTFGAAVTAGKARLSFDRPENREFLFACWKYILDLGMRSTWRTAYEWAKLLFSLGLLDDPYAMMLVMDQYALRANQAEHYLKLYDTGIFGPQCDGEWSVQYSRALCLLRLSRNDEAKATLLKAMEHDRYTAHQLCKLVEIEPIPPALWAHHEAPDPNTNLYSTIYTTRAKDLWNNPEAKSLLKDVAKDLPKANPSATASQPPELTIDVARHVYLTENDAFMRLLAASEAHDLNMRLDPGDRPTQDPFPPHTEVRTYDPRPVGGRPGMVGPGIEALGRLPESEVRRMLRELAGMRVRERGADDESWDEAEDGERSDEDDDMIAGTAR